jgi:hypothetical protein
MSNYILVFSYSTKTQIKMILNAIAFMSKLEVNE